MSITPIKAQLVITEGNHAGAINCLFNPKEYSISKSVSFSPNAGDGKDVPFMEFSGGAAATLDVELFFDTYEAADKDVRNHVRKIFQATLVDSSFIDPQTKKSRPPKVMFRWGQNFFFIAFIQSLTQKFTMFTPDGIPVRATLNLSLVQAMDDNTLAMQNPTSGGEGGEQLHTVQQGETLGLIAHRTLGNAAAWRSIADANQLGNVRKLVPGTVLVIPNG